MTDSRGPVAVMGGGRVTGLGTGPAGLRLFRFP
jgi:hypothetical protein